jgi:hypothetical protein
VKDTIRDLMAQVRCDELPADAYSAWSVDDAVQQAAAAAAPAAGLNAARP